MKGAEWRGWRGTHSFGEAKFFCLFGVGESEGEEMMFVAGGIELNSIGLEPGEASVGGGEGLLFGFARLVGGFSEPSVRVRRVRKEGGRRSEWRKGVEESRRVR